MKLGLINIISLAGVFAVLAIPTASNAATNQVVEIHNKTGTPLRYVYLVTPDTNGWGTDWLGRDIISPEETERFDASNSRGRCTFDLKVRFANGAEQTLFGINTCSVSHIDALPNELVVAY